MSSRTDGFFNQGIIKIFVLIDEYFSTAHERERLVFDRVAQHLKSLGEVVIEPVSIGIMFKNGPRFAELRTMKKWVALTFMHPMKLESDRFSRNVIRI